MTDPDIWYSYRDNNTASPLGTPCFGYYAPTAGTIAPGSTTECPRLFPELYTGGVGPHGMTKYNYDPANPNPKKFPPYYDDSVIFGEWTQDTLREAKLDDQNRIFKINNFLDCGSRANTAAGTFQFECDNPMDMQWGADGAFYLLTYGNGFNVISPDAGMYKWEYVKGKRAAEGRADHGPHRRRLAADGELLQRGLAAMRIRATRSASSGTSATARRSRPSPTRRTPTRSAAASPPR